MKSFENQSIGHPMLFDGFWQTAKKVGKLPIVPDPPDLTIADLHWSEMAHKDTFFHFLDLNL